jgi:hypothetical protein
LELAVGQQLGTGFKESAVTDAGGTIGVRRQLRGRGQPAVRTSLPVLPRANLSVALLALAGVLLPSEAQISLADGARFTPGRVAATLLLFPALLALCQRGRRFISCDFLAFVTVAWMIVASLISVGESALSAAGGDALDFLGGYLIARGFFFGRPALDTFVRVLKVFAIIAIILAMADRISGRLIVHETIAAFVNASKWPETGLRDNVVRAASTFDHAILFGVFCALTAAILLYWEQSILRRSVAVSVCFLGCMLSQSSGALMAFLIALLAYAYDQSMKRYSWRWGAFWLVVGTLSFAAAMVSTNPLNWVISHLTLDPQTGYFRIMIWEAASAYIALSPVIGYAYQSLNNNILNSVDSIWLLQVLRFGVPMFFLFFLTNIAALLRGSRKTRSANNGHMDRMRTAFTLVILMFMFTGLTVDFWNYMWMFWGLCIGIRASLRELSIKTTGLARS